MCACVRVYVGEKRRYFLSLKVIEWSVSGKHKKHVLPHFEAEVYIFKWDPDASQQMSLGQFVTSEGKQKIPGGLLVSSAASPSYFLTVSSALWQIYKIILCILRRAQFLSRRRIDGNLQQDCFSFPKQMLPSAKGLAIELHSCPWAAMVAAGTLVSRLCHAQSEPW